MKKLRVLIVNGTLYGGGAEHVIATLVRNLSRSEIDVSVCCLKDGGVIKDELEADNYEVIDLSSQHKSRRNLSGIMGLRRLIRERHIDIIHSHDLRALIDCSVNRLLTRQVRYVHTFHFGNYPHRPRKYLLVERLLSRIPDRLVAVGMSQAETLVKTFDLTRRRLRVVWNGVDPITLNHRHELAEVIKSRGKLIIGTLGTLIPQKDYATLLRAVAILKVRFSDFRLIIAGDGPLRKELEQQQEQLGLQEHVRMLGWVADASQSVLPHFDIFVQSSRWEAMSIVILEAMAAKKPIVATRVGDNPKVIVDGETGLLVDSGDAEAIALTLEGLLISEAERRRLGEAARRRFAHEFTGRAMAKRYEALYFEMVPNR